MRGHIRQLPSGSWEIVVYLGRDVQTGKKKYQSQTYRGTKKEAERKLTETLRTLDTGSYVEPRRLTIGEFLERWLADYVVPSIPRASTRRGYEMIVRKHLIPALGHLPLQRLSPIAVQGYYAAQLAGGRIDAKGVKVGKGLSRTSVAHHHAVLHEALEHAVKWGLVGRNVADAVEAPSIERQEMRTWSAGEARHFLATAAADRFYPMFLTAVLTGMRQGELLGLRWSDLDLAAGTISVQQTLEKAGRSPRFGKPKTSRSRRVIAVPPLLADALSRLKTAQEAERREWGAEYRDYNLVFTVPGGAPVHPSNLHRRRFVPLMTKAEVPRVRFHDLRHLHATLMLAAGVHPKVVSERLGHAGVGITLDTYSHVLPGLQREAATALETSLLGGS